ncbi:MAG: hypothetical protein WA364_05770 [Candidatus Nitrosopolaris sp.]
MVAGLSYDFFKYSSLRKMDGTKLVRMPHNVVESTGTPQDITRKLALLEIWKIISSTTSTVHRADRQASAREFDFEGPSVTGAASGEVSNIMDITTIWLVFSTVCFVTLWVILDLIRVSKDTIAKQSGGGGIK